MDSVNKTLYIPLYGKALVSRMGIMLQDAKAEQLWETAGITLKGKSASRYLAYSMAMRAVVFDEWTKQKISENPDGVVLHIGCGLDNRYGRIGAEAAWFDIDFPEVIRERQKHFEEGNGYRMLAADMRQEGWKAAVPGGNAIIVMEGVSMYFRPEELERLLKGFASHFESVALLMDCYSSFAARASKYKNPINYLGVTEVYGMDDPGALGEKTGLAYVREHDMMPTRLIAKLTAAERLLFSNLYAGRFARSLYRMYEFSQGFPRGEAGKNL